MGMSAIFCRSAGVLVVCEAEVEVGTGGIEVLREESECHERSLPTTSPRGSRDCAYSACRTTLELPSTNKELADVAPLVDLPSCIPHVAKLALPEPEYFQ